ncbi:MAG: PTS sugar transporter subunit IIA [Parachlamydia sp.]|jgi:PTS system nitrogen regulatory IIA component|nr:PTS sugar transporter subunit IIA [Parachlamydia sp.]
MKASISDYMDPQMIAFFKAESRDDALQRLVELIYKSGKIEDEAAFYQAIIEREKIVSTGIGMGIAIPHAKLPSYDKFFIAIGLLSSPVEWNSLDGAPVRLVFMIGGPDDKQTEYLQLLSGLTQTIKDQTKLKKIFTLRDPVQMIALFS